MMVRAKQVNYIKVEYWLKFDLCVLILSLSQIYVKIKRTRTFLDLLYTKTKCYTKTKAAIKVDITVTFETFV